MVGDSTIWHTVGNNVRFFRQQQNLTQEQLAQLCHYSQTFISKLERGDRDIKLCQVEAIAGALNVSYLELLK